MSDEQQWEPKPLTTERVDHGIQFYMHKLGEATSQYSAACDRVAKAKANLIIKEAQARDHYRVEVTRDWEKKPTEKQIDDYCTLQTQKELREKLEAEGVEAALKQVCRSLESRLNGTQSLGTILRGQV